MLVLRSVESACGGDGDGDEAGNPTQEFSDAEEREDDPMAPLASTGDDLGSDEDNSSTGRPPPEIRISFVGQVYIQRIWLCRKFHTEDHVPDVYRCT